jgi:hypothetical protein
MVPPLDPSSIVPPLPELEPAPLLLELLLLPPSPAQPSPPASCPPLSLAASIPASIPASEPATAHMPITHVSPGGQLSMPPVVVHPGTHWPAGGCDVSHRRPVIAPQSLFCEHPHCSLPATQTGCLGRPAHTDAFVDEHCVHSPASDPLVWQAGSCGVGQLCGGGLVVV